MFVSKIVGCQHGFLNIKSKQTMESRGRTRISLDTGFRVQISNIAIKSFIFSKFENFYHTCQLYLVLPRPTNISSFLPRPCTSDFWEYNTPLWQDVHWSFRFKVMIDLSRKCIQLMAYNVFFCQIASKLSIMNWSNGKIWDVMGEFLSKTGSVLWSRTIWFETLLGV